MATWIAAADFASRQLTIGIKSAWFSVSTTKKWKTDIAKALAARIVEELWSRTESDFYGQLNGLIEAVRADREFDPLPIRETWHWLLIKTATDLFDSELVGAGAIEHQNPRRVAKAFQELEESLRGPKMRLSLGLPPLEPPKFKSNNKAAQRAA